MKSKPDADKGGAVPRRFWRAVVVCAAVVALVPYSYRVERSLETAAHIKGGEAERVSRELAEQFQSPLVHRVVLVIRGLPAPDSDEGLQVLTRIVEEVRKEPGVSGVVSYLNWTDPIFLGKGGGTFIIIGLARAKPSVEAVIPKLRERVDNLRNKIQASYPTAKLEITGETPLNFDLRKTSSDEVRDAERLVLPLTLLLLLVAFRSVVAAVLPLGVGLLAISMTLGASALLAERWQLSILIQNLATMLGLGLGIDYALLMVSQFRENLATGCSASDSADIAGRRAGHTLLVSAATVAIGFAALLTVPVSDIRSIGVAGLLVTGASVSLATLLLPSVLAMLGKHIDAGRFVLPRRFKQDLSNPAPNQWRQWGLKVTANSWTALLLAGVPLLLLGSQAARLEPGLPRGDWLPPLAESVRALHSLEEMDRAGIVQSLQVIVELPGGTTVRTAAGWDAVSRVSAALASDRRAGRVISLSTLAGKGSSPAFVSFMNDEMRRSFLRSDGQATLIELLPAPWVTLNEQIQWVREIRQTDVAALAGMTGATVLVGGIPALNADYDSVVRDRLPSVIALVVGGAFLALLLGFRSLFAAVKAIALNLVSVAAAFGALVLVFQDGHGSRFFGVPGGTGSVFPIVPILAFAIVFGLSMDYEVFLVARVLEVRRSGLTEIEAIVEGLARTAGLITSAAAIMVVVFAAFTLGGFLVIKMLGFTLTVAVLIDAIFIRMVIGPALLHLAGDWNWWPWGLRGAVAAQMRGKGR
jgi:putative drug exporter of the RND superfamily